MAKFNGREQRWEELTRELQRDQAQIKKLLNESMSLSKQLTCRDIDLMKMLRFLGQNLQHRASTAGDAAAEELDTGSFSQQRNTSRGIEPDSFCVRHCGSR